MLRIDPKEFEFDGRKYEVRVAYVQMPPAPARYVVKAFLGNELANGYEYAVSELESLDQMNRSGVSMIQHLIELAELDVRNKVWEKYVKAVADLKKEEDKK